MKLNKIVIALAAATAIAVLLAPFAALSQLTGEPDSLAIMRLGVVLLGGLNTALVYGVARRARGANSCAGACTRSRERSRSSAPDAQHRPGRRAR